MHNSTDTALILKAIQEIFTNRGPEFHDKVLKYVERRYGESHRHYHTMRHIGECLTANENFSIKDRKAFLAAEVFHDIDYEIGRYAPGHKGESNEAISAKVCEEFLTEGGVEQKIIDRAKELIIMTQTHKAPDGDDEARLFMDIDMSIVGKSAPRYQEYCLDTAREYLSLFPADAYLAGRKHFLTGAVDKKPIFKTQHYASHEDQAAANIRWELANIESIVATAAALNKAQAASPSADYK